MPSLEEQLEFIDKYPKHIFTMINPSIVLSNVRHVSTQFTLAQLYLTETFHEKLWGKRIRRDPWYGLFVKKLPIDMQVEMVQKDPYFIFAMQNPSVAAMLAVVKKRPSFVLYLENAPQKVWDAARKWIKNHPNECVVKLVKPTNFSSLSPEERLSALKQNPRLIQFIETPTEEEQKIAIDKDVHNIFYIKNPDESIQQSVINTSFPVAGTLMKNMLPGNEILLLSRWASAVYMLPNLSTLSYEAQLSIIKSYPELIFLIKNPSSLMKKITIEKDPSNILFINNPTFEDEKYAFDTGNEIFNFKNPSLEFMLYVVETPRLIQCFKNPPLEVILKAISIDHTCIELVSNIPRKCDLQIVQADYRCSKYFPIRYAPAQKYVIKQNPYYIYYIQRPTPSVQKYIIKHNPTLEVAIRNPDSVEARKMFHQIFVEVPIDISFECAICIATEEEDLTYYDEVKTLTNCPHKFHRKCIGMWAKTKKTCPICRAEIL